MINSLCSAVLKLQDVVCNRYGHSAGLVRREYQHGTAADITAVHLMTFCSPDHFTYRGVSLHRPGVESGNVPK